MPVVHEGCSQKSEAEGVRIRELYDSLLKQRWVKRKGAEEAIGAADILVVSPYNMQVNHPRKVLPADARVGTVDKFQGQEAAVVAGSPKLLEPSCHTIDHMRLVNTLCFLSAFGSTAETASVNPL